MYTTPEEAMQKLGGTVIFYQDKPIRVVDIQGRENISLRYTWLPRDDEVHSVSLTNKALDFRRLGSRLGYTNFPGRMNGNVKPQATFLTRMAHRRSHQGLCEDNVAVPRNLEPFDRNNPQGGLTFGHFYVTQEFVDAVCNKFPTLKEVVSILERTPTVFSQAFHKYFCIRKPEIGPLYLMYKGSDIGWSEDGQRYKISERSDYLREDLEKIEGMRVYA